MYIILFYRRCKAFHREQCLSLISLTWFFVEFCFLCSVCVCFFVSTYQKPSMRTSLTLTICSPIARLFDNYCSHTSRYRVLVINCSKLSFSTFLLWSWTVFTKQFWAVLARKRCSQVIERHRASTDATSCSCMIADSVCDRIPLVGADDAAVVVVLTLVQIEYEQMLNFARSKHNYTHRAS